MKRLLFFAIILGAFLAMMGMALAAPFLVANPEAVTLTTGQTLTYNVTGLPAVINATNIPASTDTAYSFELDLSALASGSYTVTAQACLNDPMWGQRCSSQSPPFSFSAPSSPSSPATLQLSVKP